MRKIVITFLLCISSVLPAMAGSQTGQVTSVLVRASDGLIYFYMTGTATGRPACATNVYWMVLNENLSLGSSS